MRPKQNDRASIAVRLHGVKGLSVARDVEAFPSLLIPSGSATVVNAPDRPGRTCQAPAFRANPARFRRCNVRLTASARSHRPTAGPSGYAKAESAATRMTTVRPETSLDIRAPLVLACARKSPVFLALPCFAPPGKSPGLKGLAESGPSSWAPFQSGSRKRVTSCPSHSVLNANASSPRS